MATDCMTVEALRDKVNELEEKLENITPETNSTGM